MFPPTFHFLQRSLVRFITTRNHLLQMFILSFHDLIRATSVELKLAGSTQLLTCHCFHGVLVLHLGHCIHTLMTYASLQT